MSDLEFITTTSSASVADARIVVSPRIEMAAQEVSSAEAGQKKLRLMAPQDAIDDFWARFVSKTPGKGRSQDSLAAYHGMYMGWLTLSCVSMNSDDCDPS